MAGLPVLVGAVQVTSRLVVLPVVAVTAGAAGAVVHVGGSTVAVPCVGGGEA